MHHFGIASHYIHHMYFIVSVWLPGCLPVCLVVWLSLCLAACVLVRVFVCTSFCLYGADKKPQLLCFKNFASVPITRQQRSNPDVANCVVESQPIGYSVALFATVNGLVQKYVFFTRPTGPAMKRR